MKKFWKVIGIIITVAAIVFGAAGTCKLLRSSKCIEEENK